MPSNLVKRVNYIPTCTVSLSHKHHNYSNINSHAGVPITTCLFPFYCTNQPKLTTRTLIKTPLVGNHPIGINNARNTPLRLLKAQYLATLTLKMIDKRRQRCKLLPASWIQTMIQLLLMLWRFEMQLQAMQRRMELVA